MQVTQQRLREYTNKVLAQREKRKAKFSTAGKIIALIEQHLVKTACNGGNRFTCRIRSSAEGVQAVRIIMYKTSSWPKMEYIQHGGEYKYRLTFTW